MRDDAALTSDLEREVTGLGYDFVELERAGSRARPILRIRIDRPDSGPGRGVSIDECARVSRALEAMLEGDERLGDRYVLEVSSPGVERPLVRRSDFERFVGRDIVIVANTPAGRSHRLEGCLLGLIGEAPDEAVSIRLQGGEEREVRRDTIVRAHLAFRWP